MAGLEAQAQQPAPAEPHARAEPDQARTLTQQVSGPWMKALLADGDEGDAELAALTPHSPAAAPAAAAGAPQSCVWAGEGAACVEVACMEEQADSQPCLLHRGEG